MYNYYLAEILKYESDPKNHVFDPMLLAANENCVTLDETVKWQRTQYELFLEVVQEKYYIPSLQMGYASSCCLISLKFFEGPNYLLERECSKKMEAAGKYLMPRIKGETGDVGTTGNHELVFGDKYTHWIEGREHSLKVGHMVAVLLANNDTKDTENGVWCRAITQECQFFKEDWSYFNRRVHFKDRTVDPKAELVKKKKKRRKQITFDDYEDEKIELPAHYRIKVYFVDYGYSEFVSTSKVRFIDKSFLEVSFKTKLFSTA